MVGIEPCVAFFRGRCGTLRGNFEFGFRFGFGFRAFRFSRLEMTHDLPK